MPNNEGNLLHLLQRAYKESRYANEYSIKGKQLKELKEKIEQVMDFARMTAIAVNKTGEH